MEGTKERFLDDNYDEDHDRDNDGGADENDEDYDKNGRRMQENGGAGKENSWSHGNNEGKEGAKVSESWDHEIINIIVSIFCINISLLSSCITGFEEQYKRDFVATF